VRIMARPLKDLVSSVLTSLEVPAEKAGVVADKVVEANLVGHDSHGIIRLSKYVKAIQEGRINVHANLRVVRETHGVLVFDGDWGFGHVAASEAADMAVEKARAQGIACATIFNCNDVGRVGNYTVQIAEQNFIGIMTVNDGGAGACVTPYGGCSPLFSTNPISAGIPMADRPPICVDMATSVIAAGKIALASKRGTDLPKGCIIGANGRPSTNPADFYGPPPGALLPLGGFLAGHKGYALAMLVEVLSGALSGAGCSGSGERDSQGVFILAINPEVFGPPEEFAQKLTQLVEITKSSPKAEGVTEILIPGEPEWREKEKRLRSGIFIEEATWAEIMEIASQLGVEGNWK